MWVFFSTCRLLPAGKSAMATHPTGLNKAGRI